MYGIPVVFKLYRMQTVRYTIYIYIYILAMLR